MAERAARPHSLSPRGLAIAGWASFLLAGAIFITIAWNVATHASLVTIDARVAAWLHTHATSLATAVLLAVTTANSTVAVSVWGALFGAWLARRRQWAWLLSTAIAIGGGLGLNVLLKYAYERARPKFDDPMVSLETFSFPSGHTAGAVLLYGTLAAYFVSRTAEPWKRRAWVAGAIAAVVLVAFSRMYLGAHYLSDVVAAACASTAWLALCLSTVHGLVRRRKLAPGAASPPVRWRWVAAALAVATIAAVALMLPWRDYLARFESWLGYMDFWQAMAVFVGLYVLGNLLVVPGWIFPVAAGVVFGFGWGLGATLVAAALAAVAPFLLSRTVLHSYVERFARRREVFKAIDDAVRKAPWKVVALMRLSPLLPSPLKSYFLGLTCIDLVPYITASLAGMLPGLVLRVYVGAVGREALTRDAGWLQYSLLAAGIAATVALPFILRKLTSRRLPLGI